MFQGVLIESVFKLNDSVSTVMSKQGKWGMMSSYTLLLGEYNDFTLKFQGMFYVCVVCQNR